MIRDLKFGEDVANGFKKGAEIVFKAVSSTMGAKGKYVAIQNNYNKNYVTKDGHYTAQTIYLKEPTENMGAQMIKEVAQKSANDAGDGTTTATVLTYRLFEKGLKFVQNNTNAIDIKRGMNKAVEVVVEHLKKNAQGVNNNLKMIKQVATVSANNNESIGQLITDAMAKITNEGLITVEEAKGSESSIETIDGMRIDSPYLSPYFVTNPEKMVCELKDAYVLLYDDTISTLKQILPILEFINKENKSLLIIAIDVEQEALATLVRNKMEGGMRLMAIRAPGFGQTKTTWLEDIAASCGATVLSEIRGTNIESFQPEMLGSAKKVIVNNESTAIIGGGYDEFQLHERIESIRNQLKKEKQKQSIAFHKDRLSKINGGIAIIHAGATTEIELKEKKDLLEDAIAATKAAAEEGVVAGGGSSLAHASKVLDKLKLKNTDEMIGVNIVKEAMLEPLKTIMNNAGLGDKNILAEVMKSENINFGYNLNDNTYCDMIEAGILDTVKVERLALENSVSVASMMLMTDTTINSIEKNEITTT